MGRQSVKATVDTNVLLRAVVCDDPEQAAIAKKVLADAEVIAVAIACLCEFVWVLRSTYKFQSADIAAAIRALIATGKVSTHRQSVEAGLAVLEVGGDFADGVIAFEGQLLGGQTFVSFDRKAVSCLTRQGRSAQYLGV